MKILLVDDHKIIRNILADFLRKKLDAEVIEGDNGIEGVNLSKDHAFDLIVTDIHMPQMDGIEMVQKIRESNTEVKIIALSMMDDSVSIKKMLKAGTSAYVLKEGDTYELLKAINLVMSGEKYYSHGVTEVIMTSLSNSRRDFKKADLTNRELEVLELLFKEKSNAEIAEKLFISLRTVETHKHNIMEKTGSKNLAGLVKFAIREKLFDDLFY
ncbi:MAG: response regulator transcription factor [Cyclobacteriaceae bacterium]